MVTLTSLSCCAKIPKHFKETLYRLTRILERVIEPGTALMRLRIMAGGAKASALPRLKIFFHPDWYNISVRAQVRPTNMS